jgi:hypothetical protein
LTIESGPNDDYLEHWGKYMHVEKIICSAERQLGFTEYNECITKGLTGNGYNVFNNNCKDFAGRVFDYAYCHDQEKYVQEILIYVPTENSLSSLNMTWRFLKNLFLLPYRHYYFWHYRGPHPNNPYVKVDQQIAAEIFNEKNRLIVPNFEFKCRFFVGIFSTIMLTLISTM